jgi:uncharacterized protein (DUF885 family)
MRLRMCKQRRNGYSGIDAGTAKITTPAQTIAEDFIVRKLAPTVAPIAALVAALVLGANVISVSAAEPAPQAVMKSVLDDFDRYLTVTDPIRAEQRGDLSALPLWPDDSPKAIAAYRQTLLGIRARLDILQNAALPPEDALSRDLLRERVELDLMGIEWDEARMPFNYGDGFFTVPNYAADGVVLRSEAEARAWIAKIAAMPAYYAVETANMRRGIATGFVRPLLVAEKAADILKARAAQAADANSMLKPLEALPKSVPTEIQTKLRAEALDTVTTRLKPAERTLAEFFEKEYVPHAAKTIGIGDLSGGREYYAYVIRRHASTQMTAEAIHQLGLTEVARIRAEMNEALAQTGFKGTFAEFQKFLRSDPQFRATSIDDYVMRVRDIAKRSDALLPLYFHTLPRLTYGVRLVPPEMQDSSSGYNPGSPEQGVSGAVLVNVQSVDKSPLYGVPAWFLHEGVPGHHLQIALGQERYDLPSFRRIDDINAFVEGWALYSEHLGVEMGMYRTPYENFGRLSLEMWRACRLVVDTGMHVKGWSREQAVAFLRDNTALSELSVNYEINRYIAWPAQALGYKIGEIRIRQMRARAEAALGPRFDLRKFHDAILVDGPMPLDILDRQIDRWIKSQS